MTIHNHNFQKIYIFTLQSYAKTMVPEDEPDPVTDGLTVDGVFVSGWC